MRLLAASEIVCGGVDSCCAGADADGMGCASAGVDRAAGTPVTFCVPPPPPTLGCCAGADADGMRFRWR